MPRKITDEMRSGILAMYQNGHPNKLIADRYGINVTTVSRVAKRAGVLRSQSESQTVRANRECVGWSRIGKKGAFQSRKMNMWIPCDSSYEYARMAQLDEDPAIVSWCRCSRRIPYVLDGIRHTYIPDLEVVLSGGGIRVEEVKPERRVAEPRNQAKFSAAEAELAAKGIAFAVVTEREIGWKQIRNLDGMGLNFVPDEDRAKRRREAALRHLRAMSPEKRAEYNRKARIREAAKRAANREEYNRRAREYRRAKKEQAA